MNIKPGYYQCPCPNCQEVLGENDGPRKPCLYAQPKARMVGAGVTPGPFTVDIDLK